MFRRQVLDRLIVLVAVVGVSSPVARGNAVPVVAATTTGCLAAEPRFPVIVEVPVVVSVGESPSNVRAELVMTGVEGRTWRDIDVVVAFDVDGRATARVTWWGDVPKRRIPVGSYDVVVTSSVGRSTTCVTVARPTTTKAADRLRPPEGSTVEVIVIGREGHRGGIG